MTHRPTTESTGSLDPRLRLILFGGGHGADYREAEHLFGEWVGPDGQVLLIAAPGIHPQNLDRDVDRLASHLREVGVPRLTIWDESVIEAPGFSPDLTPYSGICFAASRPHEIVPMLRTSGLDRALVEAAHAGSVIYAENLLTPLLGPDLRYTALSGYDITNHGIEDTAGLSLTTDGDGKPTIYLGIYRGLPTSNRRYPQRIANETGARVCTIPAASTIAIRDGEVRQLGHRTFTWYDPKRRRGDRSAPTG